MQQVHLVEVHETEEGVQFAASEEAPSYLVLLQTPYSTELKRRAGWMAERLAGLTTPQLREIVEATIGRWTAEFRHDETPNGGQS